MMRSFLLLLCMLYTTHLQVKVYDCFPFFNELELLEVRLNELNDVVDYFVLVEMVETFQGKPKPMYFIENKSRFEKFLDKIIYIPITERIASTNPWDKEAYQRNQIMQGLQGCADEDIIILSDVDEIPSSLTVEKMIDIADPQSVIVCEQQMFRYFLNTQDSEGIIWTGSLAMPYALFKKQSANNWRTCYCHCQSPRQFPEKRLLNAGWHFTFMGGIERVIKKLNAFSHTTNNTPFSADYKTPAAFLKNIRSLFVTTIDDSFPAFIIEHLEEFQRRGFIYDKQLFLEQWDFLHRDENKMHRF